MTEDMPALNALIRDVYGPMIREQLIQSLDAAIYAARDNEWFYDMQANLWHNPASDTQIADESMPVELIPDTVRYVPCPERRTYPVRRLQ